jgi:hypothetical protein
LHFVYRTEVILRTVEKVIRTKKSIIIKKLVRFFKNQPSGIYAGTLISAENEHRINSKKISMIN